MKNLFVVVSIISSTLCFGGNPRTDSDKLTLSSSQNMPDDISLTDNRRNRNHFQKGIHLLTLGYGVPNYGGQPFSDLKERYLDDYKQGGYGPIFLKYDYAFAHKWSIGFTGRFTNTSVDYPVEDGDSTTTYTQSRMSIAGMVRGNYHFGTTRRWDPYVGAGVGYGLSIFNLDAGDSENPEGTLPSGPSPIALEATIGARFFITPKFAAYAEVGYSQSLANFGFSFKLK